MIVYDMESFKYDWFLVACILPDYEYVYIHNDVHQLRKLYEKYRTDLWIGYNNNHYDDILLKVLVSHDVDAEKLKEISNTIIQTKTGDRDTKRKYKLHDIYLASLDMMASGLKMSLKEFEGYAGISIEESEVRFDIDRPLTDDEIKEVFSYNKHDVDATVIVFTMQLAKLESKITLLSEYNLDRSYVSLTDQYLCGIILEAKKQPFTDGLKPYPKDLSIAPIDIKKYPEAISFFTDIDEIDYKKTLLLDIAGCEHVIAFGGLHGALPNYHYKGEMWMVDVSSYYPNMMINFNLCPRSAKQGVFPALVAKRMTCKANQGKFQKMYDSTTDENEKKKYATILDTNKRLNNALKLPINTVSGAMKAPFSDVFDEHMNNMMCITGQLLLIDLIEHLEPYSTLIQSNTDGILIIPHDDEKCREEIKNWEAKTGLELETTYATEVYQKDVNNYILVTDHGVKCKGGYVAQYHNEDNGRYTFTLRRVMDVVDDAIVDYLVHDVPLETTICDPTKMAVKYQVVKKLGTMYTDIAWTQYDDNGNEIKVSGIHRINRVFASTNPKFGRLVKMHEKKTTYDNVEGVPDRCNIVNGDITTKTIGDIDDVDYNWYVDVAKNRIIDFILTNDEKKEVKAEVKDNAKQAGVKYRDYAEQYENEHLWLKVKEKLNKTI